MTCTPPKTARIYETNLLILEIVGAPFQGHTQADYIVGLDLSFNCALLVWLHIF